MALRKYVASGKAEPAALMVATAFSIGVGIVAALVDAFISQWFSLFILFPILLGAVTGGVGSTMVTSRQIRAPMLALIIGLVAGSIAYATTHAFEYVMFRRAVAESIQRERPDATGAELSSMVDSAIVQASGAPGFAGFLELAAKEGVTLISHGNKSRITGSGAWIVWGLEWLCVALFAAFLMRASATQPFCESCEAWFTKEGHVHSGGDAKQADNRKALLAALDAGDDQGAAQLLATPNPGNQFALFSSTCPKCGVDVHFVLKRIVVNGNKTSVSLITNWLMSREQAAHFVGVIRPQVKPG